MQRPACLMAGGDDLITNVSSTKLFTLSKFSECDLDLHEDQISISIMVSCTDTYVRIHSYLSFRAVPPLRLTTSGPDLKIPLTTAKDHRQQPSPNKLPAS